MGSDETVYFVSLGCAKNLVDSENMLGLLKVRGYRIVSFPEEADIAVINTCGFVQSAVEESIDTILEICEKKGRGKLKRVFVVGCFVQRYGYKLRREIPEVDGWLGTGQIHRIGWLLEGRKGADTPFCISRPLYLADHSTPRVQTTPFYSAYLKIAEGCSNRCSYCLIPRITGPLRSRDPDSIVAEARQMLARGVREINLIAQDTTMYGRDLAKDIRIEDLLERLLDVPGIEWLRLLYVHPNRVSDRLLKLLEEENALCPYLDIPLQHAHSEILKKMGRAPSGESPIQLIERIRSRTSRLALRTSLMVGFPGETEEAFEVLYDFVGRASFDHLGTFVYSPEKGTAAARLESVVPSEAARERQEAIMGLQARISEKKNRLRMNQTVPVLMEGASEETDLLLRGRTAQMAPEVDGQVLINKGQAMIGDIVPVLITEAYSYDLVGEIV